MYRAAVAPAAAEASQHVGMSFAVATSQPAVADAAAPPALVVGIDFGTYASGFAYRKSTSSDATTALGSPAAGGGGGGGRSSAASLRVSTHDRWPDQPTPDSKTRTALLYQGNRVVAWGWTAWKRWSEMSSSERSAQSYNYLENFKLLLEDGADADVDTVCPLPAGVTRVQAVADYLGEMRKYIRDQLRRSAGITSSLTSSEVAWCLTVPAIWSDAAKARMREAAHRAGMTVRMDSRSLSLTLEPEAAALSAVTMGEAATPGAGGGLNSVDISGLLVAASVSRPIGLRDGDVLLVLDCGGGTADVTLHRVRGSGVAMRLEEAAVGRGALAGGAHVDSAAWSYIRDLLGVRQFDKWKEAHPDEVAKLKSKWELSKRAFLCNSRQPGAASLPYSATAAVQQADGSSSSFPSGLVRVAGVQRNDIRLALPPGLVSAVGHTQLRALQQQAGDSRRGWVGADQVLVLPAEVVARQIFDPVVDKITRLMGDVMDEGRRRGSPCSKVLLAGGFARSPHLQSRVREALSATTPLLIPSDPGAAVVTGAVVFGVRPYMISSRRARVGYGTTYSRRWSHADALHAARFGYPEKFWHAENKTYYAPARKDPAGASPRRWCQAEKPALGGRRLARLAEIWQVEMRFGATELSMAATDVKTRNAVATTICFDSVSA
ncbi:hypothetical protein VOLCADRAFT_94501 [Volvox carteri f. nagariensis]|uniref:Uncharacterized protein n=1 Tax=Volvox carteri f. nagariensis TaxID=3068 RepID=D8U4Y8_VOLCA|nr:uncharacterized protein VOLCADRAFT_94501 [Volvox carteri f. nagariensis]EFJ45276.1 hypothetical protein VOLCADRAFT_94501 [Volvox carteri f. nagariensis]|eukprot:XP_002953652.1 hypothetical protein VOLCADRAFT_94501 [Volvox carteri f. nagariensis]